MTKPHQLKKVLPTEADERRKRLIDLTARLISKMLDSAQTNPHKESQADEQ